MAAGKGFMSDRWIYSVFPVSVATGPLGTMVLLYLVQLNGHALGTIYYGLASAAYNGIGIPAALFWGVLIDRLHKRKGFIILSYAVTGVALVLFYFFGSTVGIISSYSIISFISFASATPLNLLIMETEGKSRWAGAFAKLSMASSVGNVVGLVVGTIWPIAIPNSLVLLFLPLGLLSVVSAALSVAMIKDPPFVLERQTVAARKPSFFSRLLANPIFFITIPTLTDFRRAFRGIRSTLTRSAPLFYISTILFYVSSGLFNTSFAAAMSFFSIPESDIFGVFLAGMVAQMLSFQWVGRSIGGKSLIRTSIQGLLLRGWSYFGLGVAAVFLSSQLYEIPAFILYPVAGGLGFAIYYTSANTMMFTTIQSRSAGAALGVYSAVVGLSAMGGSFFSGFISVYAGYSTTFMLSGVVLFLTVVVVGRIPQPSSPDESALQ